MGPRKLSSDGMGTHLRELPAATSHDGSQAASAEPKQFMFLPWFSEDELTNLKLSRSSVENEDFLTATMGMVGRLLGGAQEHDARQAKSTPTPGEESSEQTNLS